VRLPPGDERPRGVWPGDAGEAGLAG
jgi:hypothetical protein